MQDNGRAFRRCLQCPAGSSPDASSGACVPPSGPLRTAASDLAYVLGALNARGAGISTSTATQVGGTTARQGHELLALPEQSSSWLCGVEDPNVQHDACSSVQHTHGVLLA